MKKKVFLLLASLAACLVSVRLQADLSGAASRVFWYLGMAATLALVFSIMAILLTEEDAPQTRQLPRGHLKKAAP